MNPIRNIFRGFYTPRAQTGIRYTSTLQNPNPSVFGNRISHNLGRNNINLYNCFKRGYIPLNPRGAVGIKKISSDMSSKLIYGGTFRAINILDAAPFCIFFTWITFAVLLFFFGAQHPEEYYLKDNTSFHHH